jgi:hypothetical protein
LPSSRFTGVSCIEILKATFISCNEINDLAEGGSHLRQNATFTPLAPAKTCEKTVKREDGEDGTP